jgi:hypothetical protein
MIAFQSEFTLKNAACGLALAKPQALFGITLI